MVMADLESRSAYSFSSFRMKSVKVSKSPASLDRSCSSRANCKSHPMAAASQEWMAELFRGLLSWNTYHDRAAECLEQTLKSLGTDYLDLYLIHWPV